MLEEFDCLLVHQNISSSFIHHAHMTFPTYLFVIKTCPEFLLAPISIFIRP